MAELLQSILSLLEKLSPFQIVWSWERGLYFVGGKCRGVVGPGLKIVVPFLCRVVSVSVVPDVFVTEKSIDITLRDGSLLSCVGSATIRVSDPLAAYTKITDFRNTAVDILARNLTESLADVDPGRLDPARGKRDRFLEELRVRLNEEYAEYGLEATVLGFQRFVRDVPVVRLLTDQSVMPSGEK